MFPEMRLQLSKHKFRTDLKFILFNKHKKQEQPFLGSHTNTNSPS